MRSMCIVVDLRYKSFERCHGKARVDYLGPFKTLKNFQHYQLTSSYKLPDIFCFILNKFRFSWQIVLKVPKFHKNPSSGSRTDTFAQTDRRTDVKQIIGAFKQLLRTRLMAVSCLWSLLSSRRPKSYTKMRRRC